jgi:two-component system, OmpR family, heavy metal sensor histidine kinase CusS
MSLTNRTEPAGSQNRWSLALRLTLWYAGTAFLLLLAATGFLYHALGESLAGADDQYLSERVAFLRELLRDHADDYEELRREVQGTEVRDPHSRMLARIVTGTNEVQLETPGMGADLPVGVFADPVGVDAAPGPGRVIQAASGKSYRVLAVRAAVGHTGEETRVLQLAIDRTHEESLLAEYRANLAINLGVGMIASALLSYVLARRGLQPLVRITAATHRVRASTLHERIAVDALPAELATLAHRFNEMLERLEDHVTRLSQFSADIAHELRTPVNNLRTELEVALGRPRTPETYMETLGSCLEDCDRLTRLIDSLLFLARAENPRTQAALVDVQIENELIALRDFYGAAAEEKSVRLHVDVDGAIAARLDRTLFQRAVGNLIANALSHTPPGGSVTVRAATDTDHLRVEVEDTGSGIPETHLPYVFDRFYRVDSAREGSSGRVGLGLSIVKSIVGLHRGSVHIESQVGTGTRVALCFPLTDAGNASAAELGQKA